MKNKIRIHNGVAIMELSQGKVGLIDEIQLPLISTFRWHVHKHRNTYYALTNIWINGRRTTVDMHRILMGLSYGDKKQVDHINGNGLDNRSKNLRIVDAFANQHNQHGKQSQKEGRSTSSKYPGICWHRRINKWYAQITNHNVKISLGYYISELEAAEIYKRAKIIRDHGGSNEEIKAVGFEGIKKQKYCRKII